ncbi:MAG: class II aldolase/adducin family protein [Desulfuromonadales bacterium]|uniref:class II aldolase/adducin family protein n=1 Tax=Desulfuromonas sp. KJ2020 TaxID=2919173 RepID=UPI0020A6E18A|nr:class II aldolase/adducin family protein [Desulfuromonas sp. KJ2020]MCP3177904.1 class II aldolase/adducin family protein [Desulfuromonas sp. KJ2020]
MQNEGVIKFDLAFEPGAPADSEIICDINAWRRIFYQLQLIGQQSDRYGGYGFGNISQRLPPYEAPAQHRAFLISGTQTGGLAQLDENHYTQVFAYDCGKNQVVARGPVKPSSEALTHAMLYDLDAELHCVIHGHSPDIWQKRHRLALPVTDEAAAYGTPAMAEEVARLYQDPAVRSGGIIVMGGHEDGVLSFGRTLAEAGSILTCVLARALAL